MRMANYLWYTQAKKQKINFRQVVWVHDEWQTEVEEARAEDLGKLQVQAIRDTGKYFKLNCPLDGEYKTGKNWAETH
jgi:DNA polymerase-1